MGNESTPAKGSIIEGCWDKNCVNPYMGIANGERFFSEGVKALCGKSNFIFKFWRYPGEKEWRD